MWKWNKMFCLLGAGICVLGGGSAAAQSQSGESQGGGDQITPSLKVEGVYRSNVYLQEGEVGGGSPVTPGFYLTARPELGIRLHDTSVAHLDLSAAYAARKYLTEGLSNLDRFNDFDLGAKVVVGPGSMLGLSLKDRFTLKGYETEATFAEVAYLQRMENDARGLLHFRPGPGMEIRGGGSFEYEDYENYFETSIFKTPELNTRLAWGPQAAIDWKFIPMTSFVASYSYSAFYWRDNFVVTQGENLTATDDLGDNVGIPDGTMSQFTMGLRGRFTRRLVVGAVGGFTTMVYDEDSVIEDASNDEGIDGASTDIDPETEGFGQDLKLRCDEGSTDCSAFPSSFTANIDASYELNDSNAFTLSYRRDFQDVYFTNYVAFHQLSLSLDLLMWNRLGLAAAFNYRFEDYEGEVDRSDHLFRARLDTNIAIVKGVTLGLGGWWTQRASASTGDGGAPNPYIEFDDVNIHAGLSFSY
jgi:hypothetical protein